MTPRPRLLALVLLCFSTALFAQNGGSAATSSAQSTQTTSGGITLHMQTGKGKTQTVPTGPPPVTSGVMSALAQANQLFAQRKIPEAAEKYQAIVKADPKAVPAQVGLMRCYLIMQKLGEAKDTAEVAMTILPNSAEVLATAADVQFRLGKVPEAERLFIKAIDISPRDPEPYLGLARIYKAYSLYRRAYENLKRAHEVAPNNGPVQLLYFHSLPQSDRVPALESYLATPNLNPQVARMMQQYLAILKKSATAPVHACKLVSNVQQTDTKLRPVGRGNDALGAVALDVKINKQEVRLALDTGSTGILLGRATAEKLGLKRLGYQPIVGVGDAGTQGGFTALVDRIRIGDLEFQDCVVKATDASSPVSGQDGLIGADVFSSYLIDIDIPGAKLRLSQLPKRPNETAQPAALQTMSQEQGEDPEAENTPPEKSAPALAELPQDAYVAPEMKDWTKVYRFRSLLLIPTFVDKKGPLLFLIDSGSFSNILSTRAAREVTEIRSDPGAQVRGMSGSVSQVYRAEKATLRFGRYEQQNEDVATFDISAISRQTGTEVSGILGFKMLRILQLKIDYRDGLVDFIYDPNRLPKQVRIGN